jgi:hypothetical protein
MGVQEYRFLFERGTSVSLRIFCVLEGFVDGRGITFLLYSNLPFPMLIWLAENDALILIMIVHFLI